MKRRPDKNRWFPGQRRARFEYGWTLVAGETWDAEKLQDVDLTGLALRPPMTLELDFEIGEADSRRLEFPDVADLQIDGAFDIGRTDRGWEVLGTPMLVAAKERDDGRRVYLLELPNALLCFASRPGY